MLLLNLFSVLKFRSFGNDDFIPKSVAFSAVDDGPGSKIEMPRSELIRESNSKDLDGKIVSQKLTSSIQVRLMGACVWCLKISFITSKTEKGKSARVIVFLAQQ